MNDVMLLVILADRAMYDRFHGYIKDYSVSKDCFDIITVMGEYYKAYTTITEVKWDDLATFYFLIRGKTKEDKAVAIRSILLRCSEKQKELLSAAKPPVYDDILAL